VELRQQYTAERQQFSALRDQRIAEQETLDGLLAAKNKAQKEISGARKSEQARQKELSSNVRDMAALITRLEQEKARKKELEKQRLKEEIARQKKEQNRLAKAAKEAENSQKTAAIVSPLPGKEDGETLTLPKKAEETPPKPQKVAAANFARTFFDAKGTLPLPVGGRIISNYNESRKTGQQKGIVIESRPEAAVISPFDGQIAFAGPFRHYGLLLIIDHGDGFHTLLAGLGSIEGSVGQLLLAGEPVGQMKNSGNEKPKLYMELRSKGTPINPIPWLLAENRKVSG
jgi:septal ring factor EnvC (AmiA/AmiB activator)